ncbi:CHAT domain-containing tetratricopeptide repeat protein [Leptolyngbya sp. GGD]|uniref:CHAT domain-containing tetratricopeptide repeat protein n=1 Tax=Leptolyngbya sp. GGD TaxID=2997907 RepID=UPI00227A15C8|nr:CHAT domain-containing tetratricopeptide repeat protein [Leptolyngbya sp. GGD]MCY6493854.1 CHAT domain-containing tetratricopeptide repeat protein [Leptolyngbya sp. GGD]
MMMRFLIKTLVWQSGLVLALALFGFVIGMDRSMGGQAVSIAQVQPTEQKQEADRLLVQGIQQYEANHYEAAISSFEAALRIYRKIGDRQNEAWALNNRASTYDSMLRYEEALTDYNQALPIFQEVKDRNGEASALFNRGNTYRVLSRYEEAITNYSQALPIFREVKNRKGETRLLFNRGIAYDSLSRYEEAISDYNQVLPIYQEIKDRYGEASALFNRGNAYRSLSRYEEAITDYNQALPIFQEIKDRNSEAGALMNRGIAYRSLSRYEEAITNYNQALPIYQEVKDRNGEAMTLNNRGTAYLSLSRYEEAITNYNQALPIYQEVKDRNGEAKALANRGSAFASLSRYEEAITDYNQALPIHQEFKDRNSEANALTNRGIAYFSLSRYEEAINDYNRALPIYQEVKDRNGEAGALMNRGTAYSSLSRYEEALTTYNQVLPIFQEVKDRNSEAMALNNRGGAYFSLARYEEAITDYNRALPVYQEVKDRNGEAVALMNRATAYLFLSRYEEAITDYNQALSVFREVKDRGGEANALMNRGNTYFSLSRYEEAITAYNQALSVLRDVKNRNSEANALMNRGIAYASLSRYEEAITDLNQALLIFQEVKDRNGEAGALNNLGFTQFKTRHFSQSEQSLRRAISLHETIRLDRLSEENKISLFEEQARSYRTLQKVLIAQNQPETALTISEWGRTKALVERLSQQLQPSAPLTSQAPNLKTLQQIAQTQKATLVEYSVIYENRQEKQLYIWVIQPNGMVNFKAVELASVLPKQCTSIAQLIGNSRDSIGVRSPEGDWVAADPTAKANPCLQIDAEENFKTLHKLLVEPIAQFLPTDPNQQVVFIPDDVLFLVPFSALKDAQGKYLIEKHTLRTASSIQLLDKTRALKARPKGEGTLIVGNPFMPNDPTALQPKQLANLPNAEREAVAIAPLFNTKAITGQNGTKNTVLQQMSNARIIHLATHGSFYDRNGFKSWLALAPSNNDSSILTAEEIAQMKLSADLVVLSACDTGRGKITGDGVVGLSRSFIAAGVPSVIVSLWSVPDAPTADLMTEFYQQLQRNPDKAQALRQAMLKTLKTHPQPRNWAAFTLVGES